MFSFGIRQFLQWWLSLEGRNLRETQFSSNSNIVLCGAVFHNAPSYYHQLSAAVLPQRWMDLQLSPLKLSFFPVWLVGAEKGLVQMLEV